MEPDRLLSENAVVAAVIELCAGLKDGLLADAIESDITAIIRALPAAPTDKGEE